MYCKVSAHSRLVRYYDNDHSDSTVIHGSNGASMQNLVEYGARVCYKSTHRMGTAPTFIKKLIGDGHEDVLEHSWVVLSFMDMNYGDFINVIFWKHIAEYLQFYTPHGFADEILVGGNLRSWLHLMRSEIGPNEELIKHLYPLAPAVFQEFEHLLPSPENVKPVREYRSELAPDIPPVITAHGTEIRLLGYSLVNNCPSRLQHATFLLEGISRACSHQIVRHRTMSFSQESQRYVDMQKGEWKPVIPPHLVNHPVYVEGEDGHMLEYTGGEFIAEKFGELEKAYREMRESKILKEDARILLPNATSTRMVMSGPLHGWEHFLWQRADKAAQGEVREIAEGVLYLLGCIIPPFFKSQIKELREVYGLRANRVPGYPGFVSVRSFRDGMADVDGLVSTDNPDLRGAV